ncbi:23 kDa integral membrane protein-like isoform X1 [Centruroides vittatus]|uniref:23 kDa integral membrane protein-like isoform X1 n=1 Tax=Centruroides vittatus TaxID=120091 RepID=UPI003510237F
MICMKYVFFAINFLLFCLGIAVTGIGIWILMDKRIGHYSVDESFEATELLYKASYVVIVFGLTLLILGFVGCCGVFMDSLCLICFFASFLIVPIILCIAALVVAWYASSNEKVRSLIEEQFEDYQLKSEIFSEIENKLECCGVRGPGDYKGNFPESCRDSKSNVLHTEGCLNKFFEVLRTMAGVICGMSSTIIILAIISLVLALLIRRSVDSATKGVV